MKIEWNLTENELPKFKRGKSESGVHTVEVTIDLLVSDGETVWNEFVDIEMLESWFVENITHWIRIDEIEVPK